MRFIQVVLVLAAAAAPCFAQEQPPAITGAWKLDSAKSDRPNAPSGGRVEGPPMGPPGGRPVGDMPGRGGPGGMRGGGNREGPWGGYGDGEADPTAVMALMRPPLELTIAESGSTWTIAPERAARQVFTLDAPATVDTLLNGTELVSKARWKKDRLVVEREFRELAKVRESYRIDPDTGELVVEVVVSPKNFPRTIELRRVYDRADVR